MWHNRSSGRTRGRPWGSLVLLGLLAAAGCSSLQTTPPEKVGFMSRAVARDDGSVTVRAAALGRDEAWKVYGADLARHGIQPVWLMIENRSDEDLHLAMAVLDPTYFAPNEAAWIVHRRWERGVNRQIDRLFQEYEMPQIIPAHATRSGFFLANYDQGLKYVHVLLFGTDRDHQFDLAVEVPGIVTDYAATDLSRIAPPDSIEKVDTAGLRTRLEELPCCTTNKKGAKQGDPLNIVVIGDVEPVIKAFLARKWDVTEEMTGGAKWRTVKAFLLGSKYRYSPISSLYVFGRRQDIALQKARDNIHQRNHLRLWLTRFEWNGKPVTIGQISRDIGVRYTTKSPTISTHKIDPQVDEARTYLMEDLLLSGHVEAIGYVGGVGAAPPEAPRHNLTGDPYYTDGRRAVIVLSNQWVPYDKIQILRWTEAAK